MAELATSQSTPSQKSSSLNSIHELKDREGGKEGKETPVFENIKARAEEGLHQISEKFGTSFNDGKDAVKDMSQKVMKWVKENPVYASLIVAGAGVALGIAARKAFRSDKDKS